MNRSLAPDMLHCTDHMTVLERQRARFKCQQQQPPQEFQFPHQQLEQEGDSDCYNLSGVFQGDLGEIVLRSVKPDPGDTAWPSDFSDFSPSAYSNSQFNYSISRTASCPPVVPAKGTENSGLGSDSSKKRKVVVEDESKEKKAKSIAEGGDSKITGNNNTKNKSGSKENSADTSKDDSKITTEVQKPDYIHVRARRGQATDSHSLAERVRREKISERMKYLQDLVPGCNKITGKAGMLDEIINYVQSLQRQVEFLSMKLAAVNPRLDFNIDNLFAKEIFPPCGTNFASIGMSTTDMANTAYLNQLNQVQQQQLAQCGLEMGMNSANLALRRTISAPVSNPETFMDSSCFTQMQGSSNWDSDLQNLYNVGFDEGRSTSFPTQPYMGCLETSNLKMEM